MLGRLTHYAFDLVLFSAFLAGVKRSTGLTYASPSISCAHATYKGISLFWNRRKTANSTLFNGDGSPSLRSEKLTESKEIQKWVGKYLDVGEFVMDQSVAAMGATSWFERRR